MLKLQIKTVSGPKRNPRQERRGKIHVVHPITSFPDDATDDDRNNYTWIIYSQVIYNFSDVLYALISLWRS